MLLFCLSISVYAKSSATITDDLQTITFNGSDYIRLDDLLKNVSVVNTGGHAKIIIQEGEVKVNGEVCTMRGKKLRQGDCAEYERIIYDVK